MTSQAVFCDHRDAESADTAAVGIGRQPGSVILPPAERSLSKPSSDRDEGRKTTVQETRASAPAFLIATAFGKRKTFALSNGIFWRIGRSDDNDAVLDTDFVSRHHAMIQRTAETTYCFIDMGSRNGSFVNKSRVSVPRTLCSGDTITIGDWALQFQAECSPSLGTDSRPRLLDATTVTLFACRKITVLVIDMRNFTALTQRLDEEVLCQLIGTGFAKAVTA